MKIRRHALPVNIVSSYIDVNIRIILTYFADNPNEISHSYREKYYFFVKKVTVKFQFSVGNYYFIMTYL